jgi:putative transcriptional regulator
VRKVLVWARAGARYPSHRHLGDEEILVLQGALRDRRGVYRPGQICRSATGSVHSEEVDGSEDCVCFVVYHGGHEPVAE